MSLDQTIDHEIHKLKTIDFHFEKGEFLHKDGWGLSYIIDGNLKSYHSIDPVYESELNEELIKDIMR